MSATNGALVEQVRQYLDHARQAGDPVPGRPTLTKLTGATDWAIRQALATLEAEQATSAARAPATPTNAAGSTTATAADPAVDTDQPPTSAGPVDTTLAAAGGVGSAVAPAPPSPESGLDTEPGHGSTGGRLVAWSGFLFGAVASIAANVLAARIPPEHAGPGWQPSIVAEIGAAVWPVCLLLSVEALSRVRWPKGPMWRMARFGGAGTVALGSAVISYGHINQVLTSWGYTMLGAGVGPLVIDGLMTICGFAMLAGSTASRRRPTATGRQPAAVDDSSR